MVRLQLVDFVDHHLLLDVVGDEMAVYQQSRDWIQTEAAADPARREVYERFLLSTRSLVDQPPPEAGFFAVINKPLRLLWLVTWPWAQPLVDRLLLARLAEQQDRPGPDPVA